ncbi:MAG TPA: hypothetical protein VGR93_15205 [Candidatus Acidoferrales bacterium]|nr:hypothetical protein [Candidatus Acidoferrales bacterium]
MSVFIPFISPLLPLRLLLALRLAFLQFCERGLEGIAMADFVAADFLEARRSSFVSRGGRIFCEPEVHRFDLVRFALDCIVQIVGIVADEACQPRLCGEMLETLGVSGLLEQIGEFCVAGLSRVLGVKHVLRKSERFTMHGRRQILHRLLIEFGLVLRCGAAYGEKYGGYRK